MYSGVAASYTTKLKHIKFKGLLMKTFITILSLVFSIYSGTSLSATIQPALNISTPTIITNTIKIAADFGIPGNQLILNDLTLNLTFSDNVISVGEVFGYKWLLDPSLGIDARANRITPFNTNWSSLSISFANDAFIDNDGIGRFNIFVLNGDGANLTGITLNADATIQTVPLPNSIVLFLSGFILLIRNLQKTHNKSIKFAQKTGWTPLRYATYFKRYVS